MFDVLWTVLQAVCGLVHHYVVVSVNKIQIFSFKVEKKLLILLFMLQLRIFHSGWVTVS